MNKFCYVLGVAMTLLLTPNLTAQAQEETAQPTWQTEQNPLGLFVNADVIEAEFLMLANGAIALTPKTLATATTPTNLEEPKIMRVMRQGRDPRVSRVVPMTRDNYHEFNLVQ